jgi:hypothetical protein
MIPNPYEEKPSPESVLLDILSRKAGLTTKETYEFFLAKYKPGMSLQGFYKIVRQLLADRVIVKNNGALSLYSAWVQNLVKFTERAKQTYLSNETGKANIILEEGESKSYIFERPTEMDTFWDHALLTVSYYYRGHTHKDVNAYSKNFYSWIQILRTDGSVELAHAYEGEKMHWYMASGSKSLLNRLVPQIHTAKNFHFVIYPKLTDYGTGKNNFHVTVLGDFIFETKLPGFIFEDIQRMFDSVRTLSEFNAEEMQKVIYQTGKTTLVITRDARRAEAIRKEIKSLF